jgi:asparagine synthase (glutamine-hydrolysing)
MNRFERLPLALRSGVAAASRLIPRDGRIDSARSRARRMGRTIALDPADRYLAYMTQGVDRRSLYTPEFEELARDGDAGRFVRDAWEHSSAGSYVDRMLDVDTAHYLPDDLLTKVDIATMACSLEGRSPFLDHHLMEFAASLPADLKVRGATKKVALRMAMRGLVPDEILDAPKRGFRPPLADWFRGELADFAREVLLDPRARERGFLRPEPVAAMLERHRNRVADESQGIWTLLMFELWQREFVDARAPEPVAAVR